MCKILPPSLSEGATPHTAFQEYCQFDHTDGSYHDTALAGDVLTDGEYTPALVTREPDGLIWGHSSVLELDLCWDRGELRLQDPETGEFLPTPEELRAARDSERAGREAERAAREAAEARVLELEAELGRMRGQ